MKIGFDTPVCCGIKCCAIGLFKNRTTTSFVFDLSFAVVIFQNIRIKCQSNREYHTDVVFRLFD